MADGNDLLLKISADASNVKKAFDDVREQTEDLEGTLSTVAKISAVGFAALTAEVGFSIKAFAEAEAASRTLSQALQTQGIYSEQLTEDYKSYASAVQAATGIDDDAVTSAQAVAQGYLGQTKITKDLTFAIADLATAKGVDLNSAAALVAKTIGTETNALAREGLQLSDTMSKAERYAKTLEFLQGRYEGQAAAANQGLGGLQGLESAFGNLQEGIGQRFAPAATKAIEVLTNLFNVVSESEELTNFAVALIAAGLAVTALGVGIPIAVTALGAMKAAMIAAGVATSTTKLAVTALVGATGIGLLVVAVTELVLHWDTAWPRIQQVALGAIQIMTESFKGFGQILSGVFTLDLEQIKGGIEQVKTDFKNGADIAFKELPAKAKAATQEQNAVMRDAANQRAADEAQEQSKKRQLANAEQALILLQLKNGSAQAIELKKAEIETLKQLLKSNSDAEKDLLQEKYDKLAESEKQQQALDAERKKEFNQLTRDARIEADALELEDLTVFQEQKRAAIEAGLLTEQEAEQKYLNDIIAKNVAAHNTRLADTKKYGAAYAAINQALNSSEVQGFKQATGELVQLTQSKNSTLKAIGKAATISQIAIKTAESAMNIYAGFSAIPFIGPALGLAGAIAAVAFGAEQISNVVAAADGGMITGGMAGRDSVPALLMPGELVVPTRNFDEVVSSVAATRNSESGSGEGFARIELSFTDDIMDFIETKLVERRNLSLSIQGAS